MCIIDSGVHCLFKGNPLEEKHSAEGDWRDQVQKRLPKLRKLDGEIQENNSTISTFLMNTHIMQVYLLSSKMKRIEL